VGDIDHVNAVDGTVVVEVVTVPVAAMVTVAGITKAIVDATVKADMQAPVAAVEAPAVVIPTPVAGSPESSVVRRCTPCTWNPVVAGRRPTPVARSPEIVGRRRFGLIVFGQLRGRLVGVFSGHRLAISVELVICL
jgi:hypothetical protein